MSSLTPDTAVLRRPWQVDWKDPQWSVVDKQEKESQQRQHGVPSAPGALAAKRTDRSDDDGDASSTSTGAMRSSLVVVDATTALVHPHDMPDRIRERILLQAVRQFNDDNGTDSSGDWLLSVRLLADRMGGDESDNHDPSTPSTAMGVVAASQIQIQVLHVRTASGGGDNNNNNNTRTSVVLSKQLQWPETIDNTTTQSSNDKGNKKKNKNWFVSKVWKPLLGEIDEEEQDERDDKKERKEEAKEEANNDDAGDAGTIRTTEDDDDKIEEGDHPLSRGVVSAALCCNEHKSSSTNNDGTTSTNATTTTTTTATKAELSHAMDTIQMMNLGIPTLSSSGPPPKSAQERNAVDDRMNKMGGGGDVQTAPHQSPSWDIYLACINHSGKVFVYNPWDLLMPESNKKGSNNDMTDGDDMARMLFGHDLFASLEQTWRPLSEPLATLLPSVFSSGAGAGREGLGGGEEDASHEHEGGADSEVSPPPPPPPHVHDRDDQSELDASLHSLETSTSGGTMTSKRRRQRQRRRKRRRQQQNPFFLWNPTFDPSTLKDATVENRPLSVHSAGSSYLVILGSGVHEVKDKDKRRVNNQQKLVNHDVGTGSVGSTATDPRDVMLTSLQERPWWEKSSSSSNHQDGGVIDISGQDDNMVAGTWNDEDKAEDNKLDANNDKSQTMEAVQSTVPSMVHPKDHHAPRRQFRPGGFVTFVSTAHWSESRTLFLPFAPTAVSFIAEWKRAEWILVMGVEKALLVRMDTVTDDIGFLNHPITIPIGPTQSTTPTNLTPIVSASEMDSGMVSNATMMTIVSPEESTDGLERLLVKKYQILPIEVEVAGSIIPRLLCGSASKVEPPSLLELYVDHSADDLHALVLLKSLSHCTAHGSVALMHRPSDVAKIAISSNAIRDEEEKMMSPPPDSLADAWAQHGQGWSLVGNSQHIFLICWEGATLSDGAYVQEVSMLTGLPRGIRVTAEHIMAFPSATIKSAGTEQGRDPQALSALASLPFSTPSKDVIGAENTRTSQIVNVGSDVIFDAMKSLSQANTETETIVAPKISSASSFRRKSQLLLQHCASWRQLEDTVEDRVSLQQQVPMVALQAGTVDSPHRIFSIRALVDQNGAASPFQQVLAWLAQRGDYFDAASLALDLLNDADCLFHLWRNADMIDEVDGRSKLEGLLDGIIPVKLIPKEGSAENLVSAEKNRMTVAHLADMTIGCMIKGGYPMARTLRRFLSKNDSYDPARACLMLAATTAYVASGDSEAVEMAMGNAAIESYDDLLWPVHCILQIGKSRNYLETALQLLNVTIPDELRHRARTGEEEKLKGPSVPDIELTKKLVSLVVASDPAAMNIMFDFEDAESGCQYWQSLDHETRLALALIEIDSAFPLLRHPEVRAWLRGELDGHLKDEEISTLALPTPWLQRLSIACLTNSGCDISALEVSNGTSFSSLPETPGEIEDDGLKQLKVEIAETRDALFDAKIDFDIVIACLLLLDSRKTPWFQHGRYASTQSLLDVICYLAGRGADVFSVFDKSACMKYCFLANNISAGANLIGGKNGFILQCCDVLTKELNMSMSDAERLVVSDKLDLSSVSNLEGSSFEFKDTHRKLLWLLDENVLSVRTFGQFDTLHTRGRVDPIFAARSILRTWLAITYCDLITATEHLGSWLSRRLEIDEENHDGSTRRLACAALARALVFSETLNGPETSTNGDNAKTLASSLNMNQKLVAQICHSCCGIVHSVDPKSLSV